jgi:hypothetical protein
MSKKLKTNTKEKPKSIAESTNFAIFSVENFMGGTSYEINPLDTLRIVAASSIFGEAQYYRDGLKAPSNLHTLTKNSIFFEIYESEKTSNEIFEETINLALNYDFKGTLDLALELRTKFLMRINPAVIFIKASQHPMRVKFNKVNPGYMKFIGKSIIQRPDDLTNQFEFYVHKNGGKNGLSSLVKRVWSERLGEFTRYQLNKYKRESLIDLVRISHATSEDINELMLTGTLKVNDSEKTWETLRSEGKTWKEIIDNIEIPHMALLRNLRGIFSEKQDSSTSDRILAKLKSGVENGKQFPFRYWSAFKAIQKTKIYNRQYVLDALEECLFISLANMPRLKGKTVCLSDNSGSAWGVFNSEFGTVTVAEIANLSSLATALQSDEGVVGVFGDNLSLKNVSNRKGLLTQLEETSKRGRSLGGGTENGIWIFWDEAIKNKIHYDNVFIYSDMQAGHGELYGHKHTVGSSAFGYGSEGNVYVDVLKMVQEYRMTVNPKVNLFTVQVAGYNNSVLPENLYRGAILAGWTGKESLFAKAIIDVWDSIDS